METKEVLGWQEVSTNCSGCPSYYDEETDSYLETEGCDGICYEDDKGNLDYLIQEWADFHGYTDETIIKVVGSRMGWLSQNGYKNVAVKDVAQALFLNGDFTIRYELSNEHELTAQRWSHDEPMGTGIFTFTKSNVSKCDVCGELDEVKTVTETYERFNGEQGETATDYCSVCYEMRIG